MRDLIAETRVKAALSAPVPAAALRDMAPGDQVLVYREPPTDRWVGPLTVVAQEDKRVWLAVDGLLKQFSIGKNKRYLTPVTEPMQAPAADEESRTPADDRPPTAPPETEASISVNPPATPPELPPPAPVEKPDYGGMLDAVISGEHFVSQVHAGCRAFVATLPVATLLLTSAALNTSPRLTSTILTTAAPVEVHLTESIPQGDPRVKTARFMAAARKDVDGLVDRGTVTKVKESDVPAGANNIRGRLVCTLKNSGTRIESVKARFVAQGYRDKAKWFVVHNLGTLRQRSTRLLTSTSAVMGFRLFSHDITQANLQSQDHFSRELYLRPRAEDRHLFDLAEGELLSINLPLYGICDAGDNWQVTFSGHIEEDLRMLPLTSDISLYFKKHPNGTLSGMLGTYVDNSYMDGDGQFQDLTKKTWKRFQAKERTLDDDEFVGVRVSTLPGKERCFTLDQADYAAHLTALPTDAPFAHFASRRATVAWLVHTRPDLSCGVNQAAQVTENAHEPPAVKALNKLIRRAITGRDLRLTYPPLDVSTLHMCVYSDSSFANNPDQSSQIGYIVLL